MAGSQGQEMDASEPATAFRLQKAHERGSIVRSTEVTFALVILACTACAYGLGPQLISNVAGLLRRGFPFVTRGQLSEVSALEYIQALAVQAAVAVAPLLFAVWVTALLSGGLQARGVFSTEPMKPDFSRLNPGAALKRLFSPKSLHDLWRNSAKIAAVCFAAIVWARHHANGILSLSRQTPRGMARSCIELLGSALMVLGVILFAFALLDWGINRQEYLRNMRMSRREIKDEHREREGDPRIRKRLRELRLTWLKRARQLANVRRADVLLTNPTHFAVTLEYRQGEMPAPMITARGAGELALNMRKEAHRHNIPVVENAPLARALFALEESARFVPENHFEAVARVLRWVYAARRTSNHTGGVR